MLDKSSATPLHMQLTGLLCRQIDSGQLPPHAQLPSERDLCQQYGVSRTTVRKALAQLLYKGRIYTSVGKGTYVAAQTLHEELQPLSSFTDDVRRRGMRAGTRILEAEIVPASDALAARLQVPQGAEVVRLYRLRLADDMPIALQRTHLPHHLCPDILQHDLSSRSLFELLRTEYHLHMAGADTDIEAVLARPEEARLLQLSDPAAVLISEQTTYLDTDAVIELTRSVFRGDRYKLHTHTCLGQLRP